MKHKHAHFGQSTHAGFIACVLISLALLCALPSMAQRKKNSKKEDAFMSRLEQIKAELKEEEAIKKKAQKQAAKAVRERIKQQESGNTVSSDSKFKQEEISGAARKAAQRSAERQAESEIDEENSKAQEAKRLEAQKAKLDERNSLLEKDPAYRELLSIVAERKAEALIAKEEETRKKKNQKRLDAEERAGKRERAISRKKAMEQAQIEEAYMRALSRSEQLARIKKKNEEELKRIKALASSYPQGITEEVETEKDRVIVRRIKVEGKVATEYTKVTHHWEGVFYFRNGLSIPMHIWDTETKT